MLTPVRCFTCGSSLGDLAPIYHLIRARRMAERYGAPGKGVAPTRAASDPTLTGNLMGDVLDALHVEGCCRTRLVTATLLAEVY